MRIIIKTFAGRIREDDRFSKFEREFEMNQSRKQQSTTRSRSSEANRGAKNTPGSMNSSSNSSYQQAPYSVARQSQGQTSNKVVAPTDYQQQQHQHHQNQIQTNQPAANYHQRIPAPFQTKIVAKPPVRKPKQYHGVCRLDRYQIIKQLGKGTFGIVYKGIHKQTGYYVAIKKILIHKGADCFPVTAFREIDILKNLQSPECKHIIELIDMIRDRPPPNDEYTNYDSSKAPKSIKKSFYMVFPYMSYDLSGILGNPSVNLTEPDIKSIMKQLLDGINFIHASGYLHRDIKAANLLINWEGVLKIGDFGLARSYGGPRPTLDKAGGGNYPLTEVVMTRWYRAPEVLFGDKLYTTAVDIWGIGCVFGELYERKPILPGKSDLDQAYDIFKLVGEANENNVTHMDRYKFEEKNIILKPTKRTLEERFAKSISSEGVDLLAKMLALDPERRTTGLKALEHPYFNIQPLPTETVDVNFPECHEADIARFKEENRKNNNNNNNGAMAINNNSKRPYPNALPRSLPKVPAVGAGFNNTINKPKTSFIKHTPDRVNNQNDNRIVQRPAHPQDLDTPPPAPSHSAQYQSNNMMDQRRYGSNNNNNHRYGAAASGYTRRQYESPQNLSRRPPPPSSQPPQVMAGAPPTQPASTVIPQSQLQVPPQHHRKYSNNQEGTDRYYDTEDVNGFQEFKNQNNGNSGGYYPTQSYQRSGPTSRSSDRSLPSRDQQQNYPPTKYNERQRPYHYTSQAEARAQEAAKRRKLQDQGGGMDY